MAKRKTSSPVAIDDAEWRARDDARTLMESIKIKRDPKRLAAAQTAAKTLLDEARATVANARRVSG